MDRQSFLNVLTNQKSVQKTAVDTNISVTQTPNSLDTKYSSKRPKLATLSCVLIDFCCSLTALNSCTTPLVANLHNIFSFALSLVMSGLLRPFSSNSFFWAWRIDAFNLGRVSAGVSSLSLSPTAESFWLLWVPIKLVC